MGEIVSIPAPFCKPAIRRVSSGARPMLTRIRSVLRKGLAELLYAAAWKLGIRGAAPTAAHRAIFERIHADNEWGDPESRSGPGSTEARGVPLRSALAGLFERHSVATLLDAPCGDFNWMRHVTSGLRVSYTGVDVVREVISRNDASHGDERHRFLCGDITRDPLPRADLILCRDALVHLSFGDIRSALDNFRASGSRFLLTTTFVDLPRNEDIRTGGWRPLNLQAAPFHFPEPVETIDDLPAGGAAPGKRLALWELASLARATTVERDG
jgi:hypothetical protein